MNGSNVKTPASKKQKVKNQMALSAPKLARNRLPFKLLTIPLFLTALTLAWLVWSDYELYRGSTAFRTETLRIAELRGQ
jgi:hypothetical protein